jgi:glyoxylase-like metal-dependent hydrolase (beta-lactamase superfamily II)
MTPGHTAQDLTLMAETDDGVVACTHAWWRTDRTPKVDPGADDQAALEESRHRILAGADVVVPGHGEPFRTERRR